MDLCSFAHGCFSGLADAFFSISTNNFLKSTRLPLEADLLLVRRDPAVVLPYPLQFLGPQTLVEYKSPDDTADQAML
jgi:hypothetical protein